MGGVKHGWQTRGIQDTQNQSVYYSASTTVVWSPCIECKMDGPWSRSCSEPWKMLRGHERHTCTISLSHSPRHFASLKDTSRWTVVSPANVQKKHTFQLNTDPMRNGLDSPGPQLLVKSRVDPYIRRTHRLLSKLNDGFHRPWSPFVEGMAVNMFV